MQSDANGEFWIAKGELVPQPELEIDSQSSERAAMRRRSLVKVSSSKQGTSVSWTMFSANWSSLFFAKEWIGTFPGPYTLRYFLSGWFTERYTDPMQARDRIDQLIAKSDIHLSQCVFTRSFDPVSWQLPDKLRTTLEAGRAEDRHSIDCRVDPDSGRVTVERIGSDSAIAKVWGLSPVSYPCIRGNTYDRIVSRAYHDVLHQGRPHYDHIIAAMKRPDGEVAWIPYQRIIMPINAKTKSVRVVSEAAPVAIKIL
jgi:hypothetical protein